VGQFSRELADEPSAHLIGLLEGLVLSSYDNSLQYLTSLAQVLSQHRISFKPQDLVVGHNERLRAQDPSGHWIWLELQTLISIIDLQYSLDF